MDREIAFGQALERIRQKGKEQRGVVTEEEIREAFAGFSLDGPQYRMIYEYLEKKGIGVGEPPDRDAALDDADKAYLASYLRELGHLKRAGKREKEAVILSVMTGDRAAGERLISLFLPDVADVARLYAGQGAAIADLIGEGNVALVTGVEMLHSLGAERAAQAEGMLVRMVMDAMEQCIAEDTRSGKIGRQAAQRVNKVSDAARALSKELRRKVSVGELEQESGISAEEIREALRLSGSQIEEIEDTDGNGES